MISSKRNRTERPRPREGGEGQIRPDREITLHQVGTSLGKSEKKGVYVTFKLTLRPYTFCEIVYPFFDPFLNPV